MCAKVGAWGLEWWKNFNLKSAIQDHENSETHMNNMAKAAGMQSQQTLEECKVRKDFAASEQAQCLEITLPPRLLHRIFSTR